MHVISPTNVFLLTAITYSGCVSVMTELAGGLSKNRGAGWVVLPALSVSLFTTLQCYKRERDSIHVPSINRFYCFFFFLFCTGGLSNNANRMIFLLRVSACILYLNFIAYKGIWWLLLFRWFLFFFNISKVVMSEQH